MVEDAISFWTDIQRYEDMLVADANSCCFAPLSELYRKLGLLDDAIFVAQKGCALHPDYPGGFLALGTACYDKGLTAEARQALERVVALHPGHLQALKLLGQLYVEQGEVTLARQVLGQALQQDPDDLECTLLLSSLASPAAGAEPEEEVLEELEELEEIEDLEELLEEAPESEPAAPAARFASGATGIEELEEAADQAPLVSLDQGDDYWAIEAPEEPAASGMSRPSPIVQPAVAPARTAAPPTAPPRVEQAASDKQGAPDPLTTATLAELYVSQGFIDKALKIYRELLGAHPSNQQYRLRCAEILEMKELQQQVQHPAPPAATETAPAARVKSQGPQDDVEAELQSWLENIRRRRNGV